MDAEHESSCESDISEEWTVIEPNPDLQPTVDENSADINSARDVGKKDKSSLNLVDSEDGVQQSKRTISECDKEQVVESSDGESVEILDFDCQHRHRYKDDIDTDNVSVISENELEESNETGTVWEPFGAYYYDNGVSKIRKRRHSSVSSCEKCNELRLEERDIRSSTKGVSEEPVVEENIRKRVYRHCRNNLLNTVLSLAVGVFFASVACIALGHFLGVQDAEQSAGEMVVALKRLQRENSLLQSRLSHIKNAIEGVANKTKSEAEEKQNHQLQNQKEILKRDDSGSSKADDKILVSPTVKFSSKQSLNFLLHFINEHLNTDFRDMTKIVKTIYDKILYLTDNLEDFNNFKELDDNLSQFVNRFLNNDHFKFNKLVNNLSYKLNAFNDKINRKICKYVKHLAVELNVNCDRFKVRGKEVTHKKLNVFQWFPNDVSEVALLYEFPKEEKYYRQNDSGVILPNELEVTSVDDIPKLTDVVSVSQPEISKHEEESKTTENNAFTIEKPKLKKYKLKVVEYEEYKEHKKGNWEKKFKVDEDFKEKTSYTKPGKHYKAKDDKEFEGKRKNEKIKKYSKPKEKREFERKVKKYSKDSKEYEKKMKEKDQKYKKEAIKQYKKKDYEKVKDYRKQKSKQEYKRDEGKRDDRYKKKEFERRIFGKNPDTRKKGEKYKSTKKSDRIVFRKRTLAFPTYNHSTFVPNLSTPYNISGSWVLKLANGRNEWREFQKASDWLFERARSRDELRTDDGYWQFARASGRKVGRDDALWYFRRSDARNHHRNDFSSDTFYFI